MLSVRPISRRVSHIRSPAGSGRAGRRGRSSSHGVGGDVGAASDKLQKLAQLHEQGVVMDAEFDVQKQKILQGM